MHPIFNDTIKNLFGGGVQASSGSESEDPSEDVSEEESGSESDDDGSVNWLVSGVQNLNIGTFAPWRGTGTHQHAGSASLCILLNFIIAQTPQGAPRSSCGCGAPS